MIIIIGGLPCCGSHTLAEALEYDTGIPYTEVQVPTNNTFEQLKYWLEEPTPRIITRHILTAAGCLADSQIDSKLWPEKWDFTMHQWAILDEMAARQDAWYLCMVDMPGNIQSRLTEGMRRGWPSERIGRWIQALNYALKISQVRQKGTYRLQQFLNPETGEKTEQYNNLVEKLQFSYELLL